MQVQVGYPAAEVEREILTLARREARQDGALQTAPVATRELVFAARRAVLDLHLAPDLEDYIVRLCVSTRHPEHIDPGLAGMVRFGASPRGTIALERCARAHAWLAGRDYVSPADIQAVAPDVLRHRLLLSYEAQAAGMCADTLIDALLQRVRVP